MNLFQQAGIKDFDQLKEKDFDTDQLQSVNLDGLMNYIKKGQEAEKVQEKEFRKFVHKKWKNLILRLLWFSSQTKDETGIANLSQQCYFSIVNLFHIPTVTRIGNNNNKYHQFLFISTHYFTI